MATIFRRPASMSRRGRSRAGQHQDGHRRAARHSEFLQEAERRVLLADKTAGVMTTDAWLASPPKASFATQSGPMLVIDGKIHPAFIEGSTDLKHRDGVGLSSASGKVHFAITEDGVNFLRLRALLPRRPRLRQRAISGRRQRAGIYAPELGRDDAPGHGGYGPIIGVVKVIALGRGFASAARG